MSLLKSTAQVMNIPNKPLIAWLCRDQKISCLRLYFIFLYLKKLVWPNPPFHATIPRLHSMTPLQNPTPRLHSKTPLRNSAQGFTTCLKRSNKPLMERRRRERINRCLDDLKSLILQAADKDAAQYNKLEKADILEMTVKHLRILQRQRTASAAIADSSIQDKFRAGFTECASEVGRYLGAMDNLSPEVKSRLQCHLGNCVSRVSSPSGQHRVAMETVDALTSQGFGTRLSPHDSMMMPIQRHPQPELVVCQKQQCYSPNMVEGHTSSPQGLIAGVISPVYGVTQTGQFFPIPSRTLSPSQVHTGDVMTKINTCSELTHMPVAPPTLQLVAGGHHNQVWRPW